jgi:hypothetical protein
MNEGGPDYGPATQEWVRSHTGVGALQSAEVKHCLHSPVVVKHKESGADPAQSWLLVHSTQKPFCASHTG